jgi:hypothetical protein
LAAHGIPSVLQLHVFSHLEQKAVGNSAPPPFLGYLDGGVHKNQGNDDIPHDRNPRWLIEGVDNRRSFPGVFGANKNGFVETVNCFVASKPMKQAHAIAIGRTELARATPIPASDLSRTPRTGQG